MPRNNKPVVSAIASTMAIGAVAASVTALPSAAATSTQLVHDSFSRSVGTGFGSAQTGGSYSHRQSAGLRVDGSQAVMSLAASTSRAGVVGPVDVRDVDATTTFGLSTLPTAGSAYVSQMLRASSAGAFYSPRLRVMPNRSVYLGLRYVTAAGVTSSLASDITLGFSATSTARYVIRSQVQGSTLRTKAWLKGSAEPVGWQVTATATQLPNAGRFGVWGYLGSGTNPLSVLVDDVSVSSLGGMSTPTPVPTPNPVPPPTLAPAPPPSSARPGESNTGVPAGTPLTVHNGDLTITKSGTVIDRLDIRGLVRVKAPNVTIRRSIVRGGPTPTVGVGLLMLTTAGASNYLVEDVTLAPTTPSPYIDGVKVNQTGTLRRLNISGTVDGVSIYGGTVRVESSYLHSFRKFASDPNQGGKPSHDDAIQVLSGRGHRILSNTLQGASNAAVMVNQSNGTTTDLWINNNWIDGGGCSVNYSSVGPYQTGLQANGNLFGRSQRVAGCAIIHKVGASDLVPAGNLWADNGQAVAISRGS